MFAYVGSRTTERRKARGKGIEVYKVDASGAWTHAHHIAHGNNPAFLVFGKNQDFIYVAHGDFSEVSAYRVNKQTGELSFVNEQPTQGVNIVHVAVDKSGRFLVASNHITGSLVSFPINEDGSLRPLSHLLKIEGTPGPVTHHQTGPRPHHNPFDPAGEHIVVPDKGIDDVYSLRLDRESGELSIAHRVKARAGSGPRHVDFHPTLPFAYVVNELDSTITTYAYQSKDGSLEPLQIIPSLPDSYTGDNSGAEIWVSPNGRHLFVSNRGHESVGTFTIDQSTGKLAGSSWESTQGITPRFFALNPTGDRLFVCNEDTDTIIEFQVDQDSGKLTPTGQKIETGSPVCLIFSSF